MTVSDPYKGFSDLQYNILCKIGSGQVFKRKWSFILEEVVSYTKGSGSTITEKVVGATYLRKVSVSQQERIKSTMENSQINKETGRIYQRKGSAYLEKIV